ncbi:MAG: hypothetical protein ABFS28_13505 [Bacteroidota bacterium]
MTKPKYIFFLTGLLFSMLSYSQGSRFLDHLRIGFGAGANSAHIMVLESYNIFEDLAGNSYENSYTPILQNMGNQYFVQLEWFNDYIIVGMKPGTYTYRFGKVNEVAFSNETFHQEVPYLLRYISVPLEARYSFNFQRFRPYMGISAAYSHLLGSHDASNQTFIRPRFTAGAVAGSYIDLRYVILDLNIGYHAGLHNITSKSNRFETGNGSTFAQDDILLNELQISLSLLFSLQKQKHYSNVECFY